MTDNWWESAPLSQDNPASGGWWEAAPLAAAEPDPGFLGEMAGNFRQGVQNIKDVATGNYEDIGAGRSTPKTEALADKLLQGNTDPSVLGVTRSAFSNLGNTSPSDFAGALLEKFNNTPEGKIVGAIGGINPLYNATGTFFNRTVNPAIADATGASPDTIQLMEMLAGTGGLKKAATINDPTVSAIKYVGNKVADSRKTYNVPGVASEPMAIPTASDIRGLATKAFQEADAKGGTLTPEATNAWIQKAAQMLPQTPEGKLALGDTATTRLVQNLQGLQDKPMTLQGALEIDSALGDRMDSEIHPQTGKLNAEGNKILQIQRALRQTWEDASDSDVIGGKEGFEAARTGRDLWAASARANDIERIMAKAEDAENPVTVRKNGFRALKNNPSRMRGFSEEEKAAINKAANTGVVTGVLKLAGSRLGPLAAGATGMVHGGPLGAALAFGTDYAIAGGARALADKFHAARGNAVLETIANRPEVQSALSNSQPVGIAPPQPTPPLSLSPSIAAPAIAAGTVQRPAVAAPVPEMPQPAPESVVAPQSSNEQQPPEELKQFNKAEGTPNYNAVSPHKGASTTYGAYQFQERTLNGLINKYGKQLGIDKSNWQLPENQDKLAETLRQENAKVLRSALGREPTNTDLYVAHFLGANDARKFFKNLNSKGSAAAMLPAVAQANRGRFFKNGRPLTPKGVYMQIAQEMGA